MPIQIGQKDATFSEPTALLSDCHRRIEMFLGWLKAVAEVAEQPLTRETAQALTSALRYFHEAAPKHTADEEESLFPRLRHIQQPEVQSALSKLDGLEQDHRLAAPLHVEVERLGGLCLSKGSLSHVEAQKLQAAVNNLVLMYREHINVEDKLVFPLAARVLPQSEQILIGKEMAARRDVKLVTDIHFHKQG